MGPSYPSIIIIFSKIARPFKMNFNARTAEIYECCLELCRVGVGYPSVEVRFEKLSAEASVHTRNLPSVLNAYLNIAEVSSLPVVAQAIFISGFTSQNMPTKVSPIHAHSMLEEPVHLRYGLQDHGLHCRTCAACASYLMHLLPICRHQDRTLQRRSPGMSWSSSM